MTEPVKIIAAEITLSGTANTVSGASLVRCVNTDPANTAVVTIKDSGGTTIGSLTLGITSSNFPNEFIVKRPTDTLSVTGTDKVKAAAAAYR